MNLQVDLMLDNERRSGSSVSRKFIVRLAAVIVPVILLGLLAALVAASRASKRDRALIEQEKIEIDPEYEKVMNLDKELKNELAVKAAIQGWGASRLDVYRLLRGLQRATPPTIQLVQMVFNERLDPAGSAFGRNAGIYMKGKVGGAVPEADVQRLYQALKNDPPFAEITAQVEVKRFAASETRDEQNSRVFDIECKLQPRLLAQPSLPAAKVE